MSLRLSWVRELREGHAEKLIPAGEVAYPLVAAVATDQSTEGVPGHVVHELHEHRPSLEHSWLLWLGVRQDGLAGNGVQVDDRHVPHLTIALIITCAW